MADDFSKLIAVLDHARASSSMAAASSTSGGSLTHETLRRHSASSQAVHEDRLPLGCSAASAAASRADSGKSKGSKAATLATVLSSLQATPKTKAKPPLILHPA